MSTKRNDPCLCGSGKKFKKCCMDSPAGRLKGEELLHRLRKLCPVLESYAENRFGSVMKTAGWQDFSRWGAASIAHEKNSYQLAFTAWWLFAWLPDDQDLKGEQFLVSAPDRAIAADYLALNRASVTQLDQLVIEQAVRSPYSFYRVMSTEDERRLRLLEIYSQKQVIVESVPTTAFTAGDVLYTAVLSVGGASMLMGCMPKVLDASSQGRIESHREKWLLEVGKPIDKRLLYLHDTELRHYYFLLLNQKQQASLH